MGDVVNRTTEIGSLGLIKDVTGSERAAEAAQGAANAQREQTQSERALILKEGRAQEDKAMALARATPQELMAFDRQLDASMTQIDTRQRMIDAIDPALIEASEQVLKLLRGEEAGTTMAANDQRSSQRNQLVDSLRSQYGPGAESSSIGQRALQQFDMETNTLTQQNQQNALSTTFGIAASAPGLTSMSSELGNLQNAGNNFGNIQQRQLNTQMQSGSNILAGLSGTSQAMIQSAGAQYVGDATRANFDNRLFNTAVEGGIMYASGGASAAGKGAGKGGST